MRCEMRLRSTCIWSHIYAAYIVHSDRTLQRTFYTFHIKATILLHIAIERMNGAVCERDMCNLMEDVFSLFCCIVQRNSVKKVEHSVGQSIRHAATSSQSFMPILARPTRESRPLHAIDTTRDSKPIVTTKKHLARDIFSLFLFFAFLLKDNKFNERK